MNQPAPRHLPALAALLLAASCTPAVETITGLPNAPGGNPIVPQEALYPFPSDLYAVPDADSRTGRRVSLPDEAMPAGFAPEQFADHDGFSRVPGLVTWFPEGVDPASLPDPADPGATTSPDSPVLLVQEGSWELIPALAELDTHARGPFEQALILRPHRPLAPATGYAVLLRDGLRSPAGDPLQPTDAFLALRDRLPTDSAPLEAQRDDFELVFAAAEALDIAPTELVQAWTFHTRSEEQVTAPLLAMQAQMDSWPLPGWTLDSQTHEDGATLVAGRFAVPWFLDSGSRIRLDDDGQPIVQEEREIEFLLAVPDTVAGEARPLICFGHGFFSGKEEITWGSLERGLRDWRVSAAAIDFRGFAEIDILDTAPIITGDLGRIPEVVDRQLQNVAGFTLLARLVREHLAADVVLDLGDGPFTPIDPDAVHYMGISNGGTQGATIVATSSQFTRGALVVPGGGWTHMLQRAVQWHDFSAGIEANYPRPLDLQAVVALLQGLFDPADSLNYAGRLVDDRFDGRTDVTVTLHLAVGDSQVSNMVTDWLARAAGASLVLPATRETWGLPTLEAPPPDGADVAAALLVYDEGVDPGPAGNVPPDVDNGTHDSMRDLDSYSQQIQAFLEDGRIVQVCDGPCDPN